MKLAVCSSLNDVLDIKDNCLGINVVTVGQLFFVHLVANLHFRF
jgi:hypothetical protein